jgi:hypothetical protein
MSQLQVNRINDSSGGVLAPISSVFAPTALLVKTHNPTGVKYFCKTTMLKRLHTYTGSGTVWKRLINKHGKDISTGVVGIYYDEKRCTEAALQYSKEWDIVNSEEWANLIEENGMTGAGAGELNHMYGKPSPQIGVKRPWVGKKGADNPMFGKPSPMLGKKNIGASLAHKGRKRPEGGGKKPHPVVGMKDGKEYYFDSVADASRFSNCSRSGINKCCSGKAKTAGGYTWKYKEQA